MNWKLKPKLGKLEEFFLFFKSLKCLVGELDLDLDWDRLSLLVWFRLSGFELSSKTFWALSEGLVFFLLGLLHDEAALFFRSCASGLADVGEALIAWGVFAIVLMEEFVILRLVSWRENSTLKKNNNLSLLF